MIEKQTGTMMEAALGYANQGWAVFPCNIDKKPLTNRGFLDATTDLETIRAWWRHWPTASIGLPTGAVNGIVVLDVDVHGDSSGFDSLFELFGSKEIKTRCASTGGGGRHYFFRHPGITVANTAGTIGRGLDVRGDGGYVILSPSNHPSGNQYRWLNEEPIAPMPDWLRPKAEMQAVETPSLVTSNNPSRLGTKIIETGNRNNTIFKVGAGLRGDGIDSDNILESLQRMNELNCMPPLLPEEVIAIAESVSKYDPEFEKTASSSYADPSSQLNDDGNACRFVKAHSRKVRFVPQDDKWLIYDGTKWKLDELGEVQELAKQTARSIYAEAAGCTSKDQRQKIAWWAEQSCNRNKIAAIVDLAKTDKRVSAPKAIFDNDPFKFNVLNGTLDLKTGELLPHSAADLITRQAPVAFDPEALCPRFDQFLSEITSGDADLQTYMQKVAGYCLTGETSEQVFFILHGYGANGKTIFLETLSRLLGEYAATTDFGTFLEKKSDGPRNDLVALRGCRFASGSEIGPGHHLDETVIKQVTGQDTISARRLYREFEEFKMSCKVFLATNHLPNVRGTENGIWRRIRVIPFEIIFAENRIDKHLITKLQQEMPGILNWAIAGCKLWQKDGLNPPRKVVEAGANYRMDTDSVEQFLVERCKRVLGEKVKASDLYHRYCDYCDDAAQLAINKNTFFKKLTEKGVGQTRSETTYRTGIKLLDSYEQRMMREQNTQGT